MPPASPLLPQEEPHDILGTRVYCSTWVVMLVGLPAVARCSDSLGEIVGVESKNLLGKSRWGFMRLSFPGCLALSSYVRSLLPFPQSFLPIFLTRLWS